MRGFREKAGPQESILRSMILHFCKRLFPRLEPVISWSHGSSFTSYAKVPLQLFSWNSPMKKVTASYSYFWNSPIKKVTAWYSFFWNSPMKKVTAWDSFFWAGFRYFIAFFLSSSAKCLIKISSTSSANFKACVTNIMC